MEQFPGKLLREKSKVHDNVPSMLPYDQIYLKMHRLPLKEYILNWECSCLLEREKGNYGTKESYTIYTVVH